MARMGFTTNGSQAPLNQDQFNEFIRAAAYAVYERCPWAATQRETRSTVGIDQRLLNYPTNASASNIVALAYWDAGRSCYVPLRRGVIPLTLDDDPIQDVGEPDTIPGRGKPEIYEPKTQIEIWPRPDDTYEIKIDHTVHPELAADATVSIVDAELIVLWAMADAYDFQADQDLARIARAKFEERFRLLVGGQHPLAGTRVLGRYNRLLLGPSVDAGYVPDSGLWPSVMPS